MQMKIKLFKYITLKDVMKHAEDDINDFARHNNVVNVQVSIAMEDFTEVYLFCVTYTV